MFTYKTKIACNISEFLLQINAIKINPVNPFTWVSGLISPIYCDNRKILSYPNVRTYFRKAIVRCIKDKFDNAEYIASVAIGGIALGALVADDLNLPFVYVRAFTKSHGLQNRIEGHIEPGSKAVIIEDLISTGGSSISVVETLRLAECNVLGMIANFTYGFEFAKKKFSDAKCLLYTLTDYETTIRIALQKGLISEEDLETLSKWREAPEKWRIDNK